MNKDELTLSCSLSSINSFYDKTVNDKISMGVGLGIGAGFYITDDFFTKRIAMSLPINDYITIRITERNRFYYYKVT